MYVDNAAVAAKVQEQLERVAREEAEWFTARLHYKLHGTWLATDECPVCLADRELVDPEPVQ